MSFFDYCSKQNVLSTVAILSFSLPNLSCNINTKDSNGASELRRIANQLKNLTIEEKSLNFIKDYFYNKTTENNHYLIEATDKGLDQFFIYIQDRFIKLNPEMSVNLRTVDGGNYLYPFK